MVTVGVRELKRHLSKLLRRVREEGEIVEVTYYGEVIARLVPASTPEAGERDVEALWAEIDQLAAEVSARWPKGVSAVEAVREVRREL